MVSPSGWAVRSVADVLAAGNVLLGVLILAGGATRMTGVSFVYVTNLAPYWVWALLLIAAGTASLLGQWRGWISLARVGHSLAGMICLYWVIAFLIGALKAPTASFTGIAAYSILGVLHSWVAAVAPPVRR